MTRVVLFELNEVPWRVVDDYVAEHPRCALAGVLRRSEQFETIASDTALSPWITWPTLHRGVSDEEHAITDFGQDLEEVNEAYPSIWEILAKEGISTGVCGSLHTYPMPKDVERYAFYVPDVFASGSECFPETLRPFQDFNLAMSRESARNVSTKVPWAKALHFLARAASVGIRPRTAFDVAAQLADERVRRWTKTRRRTFQVVLAFDLFMKQLEQTTPVFATFFTNHVASTMHRYWAARYPQDYQSYGYASEWAATYKGEISWTLSRFDEMLARLVDFIDRDGRYELWIASSMGQAATAAEQILTQVYLSDPGKLMDELGFRRDEWETRPAMLPRVIFAMKSSGASRRLEEALSTVEIAGRGPLPWKRLGADVFRVHPGVLQNVREEFCSIAGRTVPFSTLGFANVPIEDSVGQSAYHVPSGSLLRLARGASRAGSARTQVSTVDVAPSLLRALGVTPPRHMRGTAFTA